MTPVSRLKLEEILIKIHETISKYQIKFTVFGSQMNIKILKIQNPSLEKTSIRSFILDKRCNELLDYIFPFPSYFDQLVAFEFLKT